MIFAFSECLCWNPKATTCLQRCSRAAVQPPVVMEAAWVVVGACMLLGGESEPRAVPRLKVSFACSEKTKQQQQKQKQKQQPRWLRTKTRPCCRCWYHAPQC